MRVIYLCGGYLSQKIGSTVHTIEIARNLKSLGAEVIVFAPSLGRLKNNEDLKIRYAPAFNISVLRPITLRISLSVMLFWQLFFQKVDIIYVREIPLYLMPSVLGKFFNKPTVIEINNADANNSVDNANKIFSIILFHIRKISFKLAWKIIAANQEVKELLSKEYSIDKDKFVIIPMGANINLFRPMDKYECKKILNLEKDCKYVVFTGTIYSFQGIKYLIEAAPLILKENKNIKFLIVGSGVDEEKMKDLANKKGLTANFIFAGEREYSTIPYYINSSDLCISFVTPKRSETFSFPIKIYEYLACGRPVVIGNLKNKSILINKKATPVVDATNPEVLSKTILETLENIDTLKDESECLRRLVISDFSWQKTAERTFGLFKSLI